MNRTAHIVYKVSRIICDDQAAADLAREAAEAPPRLSAALRRGHAAIRESMAIQIAEVHRIGGILLLRWPP